MGFFNFFKRDISEEEFQEQQKVKRGLEKTRTGFFQSIVNTLTNAQIDDDLYDQLEEQLILADVGPACAVRLVDELHDEVKEKHLKTGQEALDALRGIICQELTRKLLYATDLYFTMSTRRLYSEASATLRILSGRLSRPACLPSSNLKPNLVAMTTRPRNGSSASPIHCSLVKGP